MHFLAAERISQDFTETGRNGAFRLLRSRAGFRPAVLLRFSGCSLWSGREEDRAAGGRFCDADFRGTDGPNGGKCATAEALADQVAANFPLDAKTFKPWFVCTGGEPLLQLDDPLLAALMERGFRVAIETNGAVPLVTRCFVNWLTVSPRAGAPLQQTRGDELKSSTRRPVRKGLSRIGECAGWPGRRPIPALSAASRGVDLRDVAGPDRRHGRGRRQDDGADARRSGPSLAIPSGRPREQAIAPHQVRLPS